MVPNDECDTSSDDEFTQEILRAIEEVCCSDDSDEKAPDVDLSSDINTAIQQPPEDQLFFVKRNTSKSFKVCRYKGSRLPRWKDLKLKSSVELQGVKLRPGDFITVVVLGQNDAVAEIAEIRAIGDGRHLFRVFWVLERDTVLPELDEADRAKFPAEFAYVKAAYTHVITWIATRGVLDNCTKAKILPDRVLCYWSDKTVSLEPRTMPHVRWTQCRNTTGKTDDGRPCEPQQCGLGTASSDEFKATLPHQ
ncbi:hypothetical protein SLS56_009841 [Neofusicoccum ribis]|uniref:BAH domain-containing protein n=1 Tax=Neofusicoccum ribis TaxID=45134 RepID=A0ABR3SG65_9PEZI